LVENRDFSYSPGFDAPVMGSLSDYYHKVWCAKTRFSDREKKLEGMITGFDTIRECDGQQEGRRTDGQTPHDGIGRAYA